MLITWSGKAFFSHGRVQGYFLGARRGCNPSPRSGSKTKRDTNKFVVLRVPSGRSDFFRDGTRSIIPATLVLGLLGFLTSDSSFPMSTYDSNIQKRVCLCWLVSFRTRSLMMMMVMVMVMVR